MSETQEQVAELDRALTGEIEPLEVQCRQAEWEAECTGNTEAFERVEQLRARIMTRLANREDFRQAEHLLASASDLEPVDRRTILRWRHQLAGNQYDPETIRRLAAEETALAQQYNAFRAELDGKPVGDNEIDRILAESTDGKAVEAAWWASKKISRYRGPDGDAPPVAERLLGLVRLRNEAAGQIGYPNAYRASLELGELDQDWLFETLDMLERETTGLFEEWKATVDGNRAERFGVEPDALKPWHFGDRFFQTPPQSEGNEDSGKWLRDKDIVALTNRTFDELGFDIRPTVEQSSLFPGDPATSKKCQHAFCTTVVAPTDVRVLCNIVPGARWMSTNLHEFGHAIYGMSLDPELPYILRDDPHTLTNEAIALLMERHMLDAGWLQRVAEIPSEEAERLARAGRRQRAIKHLVFTRWVLVMCHFERSLYENPDSGDLGQRWWQTVERFQQVPRPSSDHAEDDWAAKIHFVGYPAYYQNYLLGEVFGAQLEHAIEAQCGPLAGNQEAGRFLRDRMFRTGATLSWQDLLEHVTGEPLDPKYFLATLEHFRD